MSKMIEFQWKRRGPLPVMNSLPETVREKVFLKLLDGATATSILAWLHASGHEHLTYDMLQRWCRRNYQKWLNQHQYLQVLDEVLKPSKSKNQTRSKS